MYFGKAKDVVGDLRSRLLIPICSAQFLNHSRYTALDRGKQRQSNSSRDDQLVKAVRRPYGSIVVEVARFPLVLLDPVSRCPENTRAAS